VSEFEDLITDWDGVLDLEERTLWMGETKFILIFKGLTFN